MADLYLYRDLYRTSLAAPAQGMVEQFIPEMMRLADDGNRGGTASDFATELMLILRSLEPFQRVDRVGLVQLAPASDLLIALGSANDPSIAQNQIAHGYHCFVDPGGSLTALREGRMRIYHDASAVIASFASQGRPPQRTIRLIHEMGLRAGLCLPVRLGPAQGYLFFNSCHPGEFDHLSDEALTILGLTIQVARIHLRPILGPLPEIRWPAAPFTWAGFLALLDQATKVRFGTAVRFLTGPNHRTHGYDFLWLPNLAVQTVVETMITLVGCLDLDHQIQVSHRFADEQEAVLHLGAEHRQLRLDATDLAPLNQRLAVWGTRVAPAADGGVDLTLPVDRHFHVTAAEHYSV